MIFMLASSIIMIGVLLACWLFGRFNDMSFKEVGDFVSPLVFPFDRSLSQNQLQSVPAGLLTYLTSLQRL